MYVQRRGSKTTDTRDLLLDFGAVLLGARSHGISQDLDLGRSNVNFFGNSRSDRSWEHLHGGELRLQAELADRPPLDATGYGSDEDGRDDRPAGHAASHVPYATKNLSSLPIT